MVNFFYHVRTYSNCSLFKSHAGPIQEASPVFSGALVSSERYNNEEFNFGAIGYWLRPHVVENGGREGLASANQSHRSHFFQWRRIRKIFMTPFLFLSFYVLYIYIYLLCVCVSYIQLFIYMYMYIYINNCVYFLFFNFSRCHYSNFHLIFYILYTLFLFTLFLFTLS